MHSEHASKDQATDNQHSRGTVSVGWGGWIWRASFAASTAYLSLLCRGAGFCWSVQIGRVAVGRMSYEDLHDLVGSYGFTKVTAEEAQAEEAGAQGEGGEGGGGQTLWMDSCVARCSSRSRSAFFQSQHTPEEAQAEGAGAQGEGGGRGGGVNWLHGHSLRGSELRGSERQVSLLLELA